jgi:hypothetical protein
MDSQNIALWSCSFLYLHLRGLMNPPFHPPSVFPSTNLSSFHLPHIETRQWGPHPSSIFSEISTLPGTLILHWGTCFCILYIFPTCIHYLLYNRLYFPSFHFVITIGDLLSFWPHATHVTLGCCLTSPFPPPVSSMSSEYYPGHLPLSSEFVHLIQPLAQLIPDLVVPLTLDLVTQLRPFLLSYTLQPRAVLSLPIS